MIKTLKCCLVLLPALQSFMLFFFVLGFYIQSDTMVCQECLLYIFTCCVFADNHPKMNCITFNWASMTDLAGGIIKRGCLCISLLGKPWENFFKIGTNFLWFGWSKVKVTVIQYLSHSVGEPEWHKSTFEFMDELIRIENVKLLCFLLFTVVDGDQQQQQHCLLLCLPVSTKVGYLHLFFYYGKNFKIIRIWGRRDGKGRENR